MTVIVPLRLSAEFLRRIRRETGMTQRQMAEHMGVSAYRIRNWEAKGIGAQTVSFDLQKFDQLFPTSTWVTP